MARPLIFSMPGHGPTETSPDPGNRCLPRCDAPASRADGQRLTQKQLLLPLLNVVLDQGGSSRPGAAIDELTERLRVPAEVTDRVDYRKSGKWQGTRYSPWRSTVHWTRLEAVKQGLLTGEYGRWELTDKGWEGLGRCRPGVVIKLYETPTGEFLWAEAESVVRMLDDRSLNLIFTSPPYQLLGAKRAYGNRTGADYLSWLVGLTREWKRVLTDDGSLVVNLGHVWIPESGGMRDPYLWRYLLAAIDEVGLNLCDTHHWLNTAGGPRGHCVTTARTRLNQNTEEIIWMSKGPKPKANNRNVLVPYKESTLQTYARKAAQPRVYDNPSGRNSNASANPSATGGAIPSTCLQIPNSTSADAYITGCKKAGLPVHPARFPAALVDFHVRFLTDPGDIVGDFLAGSGTVPEVCGRLNRRWIASDCMRRYIEGSLHRPHLQAGARLTVAEASAAESDRSLSSPL